MEKKKIITFVIIMMTMLQVPALWAQDIQSYDYMIEPSRADTLFWEGEGDITRKVLIDLVEFQKTIVISPIDSVISVGWKNNSKILSSIEKIINSNGIPTTIEVVLFCFDDSKRQRFIYYEYDLNFFPKESIKENFLLYFDYCENNMSNKTIEENFFNLKMRPETVFCAPKMIDFDFLKKFRNFQKLLPK